MLQKKLSQALLLSMLVSSTNAFEFQLQQTIASEHKTPLSPDQASLSLRLRPFFSNSTVADLNHDGHVDILLNNTGIPQVWINDGKGSFNKRTLLFNKTQRAIYITHLVDINQDGNIDIVLNNQFYLNDGTANFTFGGTLKDNTNAAIYPMKLLDLNNNQKLDILGTTTNKVDFWLNTDNQYVQTPFDPQPFVTLNFSLPLNVSSFGDVDGDGDLDFWLVAENGTLFDVNPFILMINDGTGHFSTTEESSHYLTTSSENLGITSKIILGDLDNDGDLDTWGSTTEGFILLPPTEDGSIKQNAQGSAPFILMNDGSGSFTQMPDAFDTNSNNSLNSVNAVLADIDNDGDLDALEVNLVKNIIVDADKISPLVLKIWLNDGTGHFTDSHKDITGFVGANISVADFNQDGLKDIMVGNQILFNGVDQENSRLCDWAEKKFAKYFPKRAADLIFGAWEYRYYPSTKVYIGVDTTQDKVFVLGDVFSGLKEVGNKQDMIKMSQSTE